MGEDAIGGLEIGAAEHGRPKQGVEIDNVLADKVVQLGLGAFGPIGVEVEPVGAIAQVLEAGHIADRCIEPNIEVLARCIGNFKTEIGRVAADIPGL